jgi:hypothetical protein
MQQNGRGTFGEKVAPKPSAKVLKSDLGYPLSRSFPWETSESFKVRKFGSSESTIVLSWIGVNCDSIPARQHHQSAQLLGDVQLLELRHKKATSEGAL